MLQAVVTFKTVMFATCITSAFCHTVQLSASYNSQNTEQSYRRQNVLTVG